MEAFLYQAVQYDKENGFTTWLDLFKKKIANVSSEINTLFDNTISKMNDTQWKEIWKDENGWNNFIEKNKIADEDFKDFLGTVGDAKFDIQDYQQYLIQSGKSTSAFTAFTKKAGTALKSLGAEMGSMAINWLIGKAIDIVVTGIDNWIHRAEKARERTSELFDEFKEMNNTLADHKKTVSELADRYDELSKGVNLSTNANSFLSTEEYEEFLDINEQLANSFPELVKGIDENGNSILTLGTKGITAKKQLEELLQTEEDLNNFRIAQGLDEAFKGVYTYIEAANEATAEFRRFYFRFR